MAEAQANRILVAKEFERKTLAEGPISCKPGCSNCCYYPINVSVLEGISIYQWLQKHRMWTQKVRDALEEHKALTADLAPEVWVLSLIPCPFLDAQQKCSIYESRPFLCRTAYSRGDFYYCHPHRLGSDMPSILQRSDEVEALWKAERKVLRRHKLRGKILPLASAVLLGERIATQEIQIEDADEALSESASP